jgi:drug/metabolite transporter (DMT)-like permease
VTLWLLGLILVAVTFSALAQIAFKAGMSGALQGTYAALAWKSSLVSGLTNPYVLLGLLLYGAGTLLWLLVLSRLDVTVAYPFVGLGFVITMILGAVLLHEPLGLTKIIGTLLVVAGVILIAGR